MAAEDPKRQRRRPRVDAEGSPFSLDPLMVAANRWMRQEARTSSRGQSNGNEAGNVIVFFRLTHARAVEAALHDPPVGGARLASVRDWLLSRNGKRAVCCRVVRQ